MQTGIIGRQVRNTWRFGVDNKHALGEVVAVSADVETLLVLVGDRLEAWTIGEATVLEHNDSQPLALGQVRWP